MADEKLITFIKDGFNKGYTEEELKGILLENGWKAFEIEQGFIDIKNEEKVLERPKQIEKPQPIQPKPVQEKPIVEQKPIIQESKVNETLLAYVKKALNSNFSKDQIVSTLLVKKWPEREIDLVFEEIEKEKPKEIKKPIFKLLQPKPVVEQKPIVKLRREIPVTKIIFYVIVFILISAIFSFTFMLFYYVDAIMNYEVTDPNTGLQVKGACLEEKCADMKAFALEQVKPKIGTSILYGTLLAAAVVVLHYFIPFKNIFVWLINVVYLVFLAVIANMWIVFNNTK